MAVLGKMDQVVAFKGVSLTIPPLGAVCCVLFSAPDSPAAKVRSQHTFTFFWSKYILKYSSTMFFLVYDGNVGRNGRFGHEQWNLNAIKKSYIQNCLCLFFILFLLRWEKCTVLFPRFCMVIDIGHGLASDTFLTYSLSKCSAEFLYLLKKY